MQKRQKKRDVTVPACTVTYNGKKRKSCSLFKGGFHTKHVSFYFDFTTISLNSKCVVRDAKLEALLARVDKFIAGKHGNLEIATAHHKRCTVLSSLGRYVSGCN